MSEVYDKIQEELNKRFAKRKNEAKYLVDSYNRISKVKKAVTVENCGNVTDFNVETGELVRAFFCKDRLCPMCNWRRSKKFCGQIFQIFEALDNKYQYIFLTLTVPNVPAGQLQSKLNEMSRAFHVMFSTHPDIGRAVKGYIRSVEITYNFLREDYHPHYHCILAVEDSYFHDDSYIDHSKWLDMWKTAMNDPSITNVDIRRVRPKRTRLKSSISMYSAVCEVAKYCLKPEDFIIKGNDRMTDKLVSELSPAIARRRLLSFGGVFAQIRKQLNLDDPVDGDLVHTDSDEAPSVKGKIARYRWTNGEYRLVYVGDNPSSLGLPPWIARNQTPKPPGNQKRPREARSNYALARSE